MATTSTTSTNIPVEASEPDIGLATAYSLVLVVTLLGNIATICNFKYNDWLKWHKCHVYILGLAVADLGTALVPLPVNALIAAQGLWPFSRQACMAYDYFRVVIENNGVLVTLLISVDMFRLSWFDFGSYIRGSTPRRLAIELSLTWLLPAVGHGVMALVWIVTVPLDERQAETTPDCQDVPSDADIPFSAMYAVFLILIPGILLAVFNTVTFIGVARKLKRRRQIADGTAFRGPPSSDLAVKNQQSPIPRRTENDNAKVLSTPIKDSKIPSLSLFVTCGRHQDGLPTKQSSRDYTPRPVGALEETGQPGPSTAGEKLTTLASLDISKPDAQPISALTANPPKSENRRRVVRNKTRYIRPAVMLAGIVSVFAFCWFPFAAYYIYVHIVCPTCFSREIQLWLRCLLYANSAINPFIYALTDRKVRHWYMRIWIQLRRRLKRSV